MVDTLAVGRVAVIGIGQGADDALAFAGRYPSLVASVTGVSVRLPGHSDSRRGLRHAFGRRHENRWSGPLSAWISTAGKDADLTAESTWARIVGRLDAVPAGVLADRWRESDFRDAVAADVAQINPAWTAPARPAGPPQWIGDPRSVRVPVRLWHGKHETSPTVAQVQDVAKDQPSWTVTTVGGSSAVLGAWTAILTAAAESFHGAAAA